MKQTSLLFVFFVSPRFAAQAATSTSVLKIELKENEEFYEKQTTVVVETEIGKAFSSFFGRPQTATEVEMHRGDNAQVPAIPQGNNWSVTEKAVLHIARSNDLDDRKNKKRTMYFGLFVEGEETVSDKGVFFLPSGISNGETTRLETYMRHRPVSFKVILKNLVEADSKYKECILVTLKALETKITRFVIKNLEMDMAPKDFSAGNIFFSNVNTFVKHETTTKNESMGWTSVLLACSDAPSLKNIVQMSIGENDADFLFGYFESKKQNLCGVEELVLVGEHTAALAATFFAKTKNTAIKKLIVKNELTKNYRDEDGTCSPFPSNILDSVLTDEEDMKYTELEVVSFDGKDVLNNGKFFANTRAALEKIEKIKSLSLVDTTPEGDFYQEDIIDAIALEAPPETENVKLEPSTNQENSTGEGDETTHPKGEDTKNGTKKGDETTHPKGEDTKNGTKKGDEKTHPKGEDPDEDAVYYDEDAADVPLAAAIGNSPGDPAKKQEHDMESFHNSWKEKSTVFASKKTIEKINISGRNAVHAFFILFGREEVEEPPRETLQEDTERDLEEEVHSLHIVIFPELEELVLIEKCKEKNNALKPTQERIHTPKLKRLTLEGNYSAQLFTLFTDPSTFEEIAINDWKVFSRETLSSLGNTETVAVKKLLLKGEKSFAAFAAISTTVSDTIESLSLYDPAATQNRFFPGLFSDLETLLLNGPFSFDTMAGMRIAPEKLRKVHLWDVISRMNLGVLSKYDNIETADIFGTKHNCKKLIKNKKTFTLRTYTIY
ncbi:MAG: uncharacterized protein A8A55_1363 [Amphiamblys sp. WSBS2006]|nr:MAG: uncharacterized protein A8A55_1363 [Amphiamblys sp. WSBS2006]